VHSVRRCPKTTLSIPDTLYIPLSTQDVRHNTSLCRRLVLPCNFAPTCSTNTPLPPKMASSNGCGSTFSPLLNTMVSLARTNESLWFGTNLTALTPYPFLPHFPRQTRDGNKVYPFRVALLFKKGFLDLSLNALISVRLPSIPVKCIASDEDLYDSQT
jgi:hypothetical protein